MPTTSPDNIWFPGPNALVNLPADLSTMATSVQSAISVRANAYKGSSAQRMSFAGAEEGSLWSDTNGERTVWSFQNGQWVAIWPIPQTYPDLLTIGGVNYQARGIVAFPVTSWSGSSPSFYVGTTITLPFAAPSGWTFQLAVHHTGTFPATITRSSYAQQGPSLSVLVSTTRSDTNVQSIAWELVRRPV